MTKQWIVTQGTRPSKGIGRLRIFRTAPDAVTWALLNWDPEHHRPPVLWSQERDREAVQVGYWIEGTGPVYNQPVFMASELTDPAEWSIRRNGGASVG